VHPEHLRQRRDHVRLPAVVHAQLFG